MIHPTRLMLGSSPGRGGASGRDPLSLQSRLRFCVPAKRRSEPQSISLPEGWPGHGLADEGCPTAWVCGGAAALAPRAEPSCQCQGWAGVGGTSWSHNISYFRARRLFLSSGRSAFQIGL